MTKHNPRMMPAQVSEVPTPKRDEAIPAVGLQVKSVLEDGDYSEAEKVKAEDPE